MKSKCLNFGAGLLVGAVLFGGGTAIAAGIVAEPSAQTFYVDGQQVNLEAYAINGNNYLKLRDVGQAVGFNVSYDASRNAVVINSDEPYSEDTQTAATSTPTPQEQANKTGVVIVPQSEVSFRPLEGDVVLLDDGTTFTVTQAKPEEAPLPSPACDWSQFPDLALPTVEAKRGQTGVIMITNLYELRRMQYTLYNCVPNCPELWENGQLKLDAQGQPILRLQLGITESNGVQTFWPWRDEQLTKVFYSVPGARFAVSAWDYYNSDGQYMYTRYNVQGR